MTPLAKKGFPGALPNPLVGCVIVKNGRVISKGYHKKFGGPHAEIEALKKAGHRAKGATLFVSLEPCSHWGKTPPCCKAIVKAGISHVVTSMTDPNPQVNGKGFRYLKNHGIKVEIKPDREAEALNLPFVTQATKKRPYIVLKAAMTLDGKITDFKGHSKWITDATSRELARKLRGYFDAILVGANTVVTDNPELTSHDYGRNPMRIILDPRNKIPKNSKVLKDGKAPTLHINKPFQLRALLKDLAQKNIQSLLVEGGGTTHAHFVEAGLFDELFYFVAPKILGGKTSKTPVEGLGLPIANAIKLGKIEASRLNETLIIRASRNKNGLLWSLVDTTLNVSRNH